MDLCIRENTIYLLNFLRIWCNKIVYFMCTALVCMRKLPSTSAASATNNLLSFDVCRYSTIYHLSAEWQEQSETTISQPGERADSGEKSQNRWLKRTCQFRCVCTREMRLVNRINQRTKCIKLSIVLHKILIFFSLFAQPFALHIICKQTAIAHERVW